MTEALKTERRQARIDLAAAYRIAELQGFSEGICNHFTLMVPGAMDRFYLIPHGMHWSEVSASRLLAVSFDGQTMEGEGVVEPTAFYIHAPIHRALASARCILHTHMPYATALTLLEAGRLEMASQTALHFHGRVTYDEDYSGVALDAAEGQRLARLLEGASVLFMKHHGVIVVGRTVADAYHDLYYLERACRQQVLAMSTGRRLAAVPEEIAARVIEQIRYEQDFGQAHFAALKRVLDRERPDYAG